MVIARCFTPLFEAREEVKHGVHIFRCKLAANGDGPHQQVLLHGHIRKNASSFGAQAMPSEGDIVGRFMANVLSTKHDLPLRIRGWPKMNIVMSIYPRR